ncbi:MAG: hypothetical protein MK089_00365, partial [Phycisphaerales bacterium]|nr:hypothetical protein [Phycisphaerales bacterium]
AIRSDRRLDDALQTRYQSWNSSLGERIEAGSATLEELEDHARSVGEPQLESSHEEMLESIFNDLIR